MTHRVSVPHSIALVLVMTILFAPATRAQNPQLQECIAEIRQSTAQNKQALAQYTWQEQDTISILDVVKKQNLFQVKMGPDGKSQKTEIDAPDQSYDGGRSHGLKHRIKEEKTEEYEDYGKQIADLAEGYLQQEPGKLQQLYEQGKVTLGSANAPGELRIGPGEVPIILQDYLKQGDSVTLIYNKPQQVIKIIKISSYVNEPWDAVKIFAKFAQLPNGPNHLYDVVVYGVSKELTVEMQNSNYQRL